ncbi:hypothetical protein [Bosea sp. (in: a-proteobacteria)]|uniref:hypothetical protein n=1 Tax=Bosea sp. (in: a-proteobacteria) TaxID=1871050 RepID=UPI0011FC70E5|nr:hypothetical protein [Bosea sp. (in: a-proteobacteria)]TAJ31044.1 MAG: hypothetical protein EPO59_09445 [Bosea sp. (in: a-proteobacteria)]
MSASEKSAFSAEQIAAFERIQALRPVLFRQSADKARLFEICPDRACRRARACCEPRGLCFQVFLATTPDYLRRTFVYALRYRCDGLGPEDAWRKAEARVAVEGAMPLPVDPAGR